MLSLIQQFVSGATPQKEVVMKNTTRPMTAEGRKIMAARKRASKTLAARVGQPVTFRDGYPTYAATGKRLVGVRGAKRLPKPGSKT